jgi:hypothetical protein
MLGQQSSFQAIFEFWAFYQDGVNFGQEIKLEAVKKVIV